MSKLELQTLLRNTFKNKVDLNLVAIAKEPSHQQCMMCGMQAPLGLKLNFYSNNDNQIWTKAKGTCHQQGYQGILHGGYLAALLDAGMCNAIFHRGVQAVTGDIQIRYLNEVPINKDILIQSQITSSYSVLYKVEASLYVDGVKMATAKARFMQSNK
ncbi:hypothetical protein PCNPT3_11315 [Psychromonas sp. CNPT3]|uniref:PaaI family thioesterase n=1 Tax=Psychromonas sp. CNPT3 TaxID=314282 RepID=UPI00006E9EA7|nr:PaaI family thioesterase [Psychromonas sp. CNPT3]AGH82199.1 hypothetical protein PCNPT3_11315 [Psychromonas sp. CNPT3]